MEQTPKKSVLEVELTAGVDCGNYETEVAFFNNGQIQYNNQPTVIRYTNMKHPETERSVEEIMSNFFDNLTIYYKSNNKLINSFGYYYIGKAALENKTVGIPQNMEITSGNKSSSDIPVLMATTMIAATALKNNYDNTHELPEQLNVKASISTAIPSSEYRVERARQMEERLKGVHYIDFYIGNKIVRVVLELGFVKCTEEGKTAMLAFLSYDDEVLKEYNEEYSENATVSDFKNQFTFHVDIGDGTSEFIAIKGVNPTGSIGVRAGVGHATMDAIADYKEQLSGMTGEITRQYFMELLRGNTGRTGKAKECFEKAVIGQAQYLLSLIRNNYATLTQGEALYIFVHGGGSCVFKNYIYRDLCKFAEQVQAKVVYIPCTHATHMNSTGNLRLVEMLLKNKEKAN